MSEKEARAAYSDWIWEKEGPAIGEMRAVDAGRAAFIAGAKWAENRRPTTSAGSELADELEREAENFSPRLMRKAAAALRATQTQLCETREALEPFAMIALLQDFDPASADMIDMPDFAITPNDVRIARVALKSADAPVQDEKS